MPNYRTMNKEDFRTQVRLTSQTFAFEDFRRRNPDATRERAHTHAQRFWRRYVELALDFMAVVHVDGEAQAAPWN